MTRGSRRPARLAFAVALMFAAGWRPAWPAAHEPEFRRLRGDQIRARVAGRDITDDVHWSDHFRRDGTLASVSMGRASVGRWKVEAGLLCTLRPPATEFECFQVWVRGEEVSLRMAATDQPNPAFIRPHRAN